MGATLKKRKVRDVVSSKPAGPCPDLVDSIREWRAYVERKIQYGIINQRALKAERQAARLLDMWERYCSGQITEEEFFKRNPDQPPPFLPWIGPALTWQLFAKIWSAMKNGRRDAAREFLKWFALIIARPRGQPSKPDRLLLGKKALELHDRLRSWRNVAKKLCPEKGPGHTCSKLCADKVRLAANVYKAAQS